LTLVGTPDKSSLREECLRLRTAREPLAIAAARDAVRRVVLQRCAIERWRRVAGYVPLRTEPGSVELLDDLVNQGIRVITPVLLDDRDLDWEQWGVVGTAPLGLEAVADVDAVLVPALAVAADGTRLGRGGGSYDRALARVQAGTTVAALLFDGETVAELAADPWDVPVSAIATPAGWESRGAAEG
jgi:5-formyltetrahydrofolate cyclo-ligase